MKKKSQTKNKSKTKASSKVSFKILDLKKTLDFKKALSFKKSFDFKKSLGFKKAIDLKKSFGLKKALDFKGLDFNGFDIQKHIKARFKAGPRVVFFASFLILAGIATVANQTTPSELSGSNASLEEAVPAFAEETLAAPAVEKFHAQSNQKVHFVSKKKKTKHAVVIRPIQDTKVIGIVDGDTLDVFFGGIKQRVRLAEIDCPEKGQAFGKNAKHLLAKLVFGKNVKINVERKDKYGRLIAWINVGGMSVNKEMIRKGYAWAYRQYLTDYNLLTIEAQARESHSGLWSEKNPTPPWNYREKKFRVSLKR